MGDPGSPHGAALALSTDAREAVIARLSTAFAHDELSLDEFEQRAAAVYRASAPAELQRLVADLPVRAQAAMTDAPPPLASRIGAVFANVERGGALTVPPRIDIRAVLANVELDLSAAHFQPGVTEISIRAFLGNVELRLPAGARVENHGSGTMASFTSRVPPASGASAVQVRITGRAVLANVEIGGDA